jgi:predicted Zn finger-like uncharacterized protein
MSLNTRCPACETVFKVVPDQLKVSSGWVRCGRCAEVFDAAMHMLTPAQATATTTQHVPVPVPESESVITPIAASPSLSRTEVQPSSPAQPPVRPSTSAPTSMTPIAAGVNFDEVRELSFVRHAKKKAFWQQTNVVRSLLALSLGLIGLLALQVVLDQRNQLAAIHPNWQAGLERFCTTMGCVIEPIKQLDAIKIESSTFQKIQESPQGDTFVLKTTIKSSAAQRLAVPALELTLTDVNDKPVLRRVLLAQELGFQGKTLTALGEWNGTFSIFVVASLSPSREQASVTGYRLLAFYP